MFEKWRIKEHMEVSNAAGQHIGTVDAVDGDVIRLTRSDSADDQHHYVDVKWIDRIDDNRVYLRADAPLRGTGANEAELANTPARAPASDRQSPGYDGRSAEEAGFAGTRQEADMSKEDAPLFGTSGHGTGMGGSGTS